MPSIGKRPKRDPASSKAETFAMLRQLSDFGVDRIARNEVSEGVWWNTDAQL